MAPASALRMVPNHRIMTRALIARLEYCAGRSRDYGGASDLSGVRSLVCGRDYERAFGAIWLSAALREIGRSAGASVGYPAGISVTEFPPTLVTQMWLPSNAIPYGAPNA